MISNLELKTVPELPNGKSADQLSLLKFSRKISVDTY